MIVPGTDVGIAPKAPRTSTGASGFGSHYSSWLCPPLANTTITYLARPNPDREPETDRAGFAASVRRMRSSSPSRANADTLVEFSQSRRFMDSELSGDSSLPSKLMLRGGDLFLQSVTSRANSNAAINVAGLARPWLTSAFAHKRRSEPGTSWQRIQHPTTLTHA